MTEASYVPALTETQDAAPGTRCGGLGRRGTPYVDRSVEPLTDGAVDRDGWVPRRRSLLDRLLEVEDREQSRIDAYVRGDAAARRWGQQ